MGDIKEIFRKENEKLEELVIRVSKCKYGDNYIWGCNVIAKELYAVMEEQKVFVKSFLDSNIEKRHKKFCDKIIISNEEIFDDDNTVNIWITHNSYNSALDMVQTFLSKRIRGIINVINCRDSLTKEKEILYRNKYNSVIEKKEIFLYPLYSIGDAYIISCFLGNFLLENDISDYIIYLISPKVQQIFNMFQLQSEIISESELFFLQKNTQCKNLHPSNSTYVLGEFKLINYYRDDIFKLKSKGYCRPQIKKVEYERICKKSKTLIIAPYSNTLDHSIDDEFWTKLVREFSLLGFDIFTNCAKGEKCIHGTKKVEVELSEIPSFVNYAGFFIGLRSGMCDLVCHTNAKKVFLYTNEETKKQCEISAIMDDKLVLELVVDRNIDECRNKICNFLL